MPGVRIHVVGKDAPPELLALASWPLAIKPMDAVGSATGRALIPVLTGTAAVETAFAALLAVGLLLERAA